MFGWQNKVQFLLFPQAALATIRAVARAFRTTNLEALNSRERKVLRYLVRGFLPAEVASSVGLSVAEIQRLKSSICRKLQLQGRPPVHEYVVAIGLVSRNGRE